MKKLILLFLLFFTSFAVAQSSWSRETTTTSSSVDTTWIINYLSGFVSDDVTWDTVNGYAYPDAQTRFRVFKNRNDADLYINKSVAGTGTTNYGTALFSLTNTSNGGTNWTVFSLLDDSSTDASGGTAIFGKVKQRLGATWDAGIHGEIFRQSGGTGIAGNFELTNLNSSLTNAYGVVINYAANPELGSTFYRGNAALYITGVGADDAQKWTYGIKFNPTGLLGAPIQFPVQATVGTSGDGQLYYNGTNLIFRSGTTNYVIDMTAQ